ncbi:hypothetical protein ACWYXN_28350 [Janthinobacterium aestuarii]
MPLKLQLGQRNDELLQIFDISLRLGLGLCRGGKAQDGKQGNSVA